MKVDVVKTGYLEENCYIVSLNDDALIIDPGDDFDKIVSMVGNKNILGILVTHHHFDHVGVLDDAVKKYNVNVTDFNSNKSQKIGPFSFEIIDTKGHKEDSVSFYFKKEKVMFTGDFLFKGSIGRCDLKGGNYSEMLDSILKIKTYDRNITIYPGHGESTTLKEEFNNNPYLKGELL